MSTRLLLAWALPLLCCLSARAQGVQDLASFGPEVSLRAMAPAAAADGGRVAAGTLSLRAPLAWQPRGEWRMFAGVAYDLTELRWRGGRDLTAHRIGLPLDLMWLPGGGADLATQEWFGWLRVQPEIASDLRSLGADDLGISVLLAGGWRPNPRWTWVGGGYFARDTGEPRLLPALGFVWSPSQAWSVALLPPRAVLSWRIDPAWRLKAVVEPRGGNWHVAETGEGPGSQGLRLFTGTVDLERRLGPNAHAFVSAGVAFGGEVRLEDRAGREVDAAGFRPAPFAGLGVKMAF